MSAVIGYLVIGALSFVSRLPESLLVGIARAWGRTGPRFMPMWPNAAEQQTLAETAVRMERETTRGATETAS
jgi:hypothetical protein